MGHYDENGMSPRRLYRDTQNAVCCGVVAGISEYFGFRRGPARLMVVVATLFLPMLVLCYVVLAFVLKPMPQDLYKDPVEEKFWRSMRKSPSATFSGVRYRFRHLEQRMQKMERYVTSRRFNLDREFEDLANKDRF